MAIYYFTGNTDSNWGTATNWSTASGGTGNGAVPTSADDAIFDNLSPAYTVNTSSRVCKTLTFTTYTNTITMTNNITVSGNVTLGASMGVAGTGLLVPNTTGTLTSNGKVWPNGLNLRGISTFTLADNWVVTGNLLIGATTETIVINGAFNLSTAGNFTTSTSSTISGAATIVLNGTGIWSNTSTGAVRNNLTINTSGTITVSGNIYYNTGTLTYTAGTVTTTGSTLNLSTCTLNTNGITWSNLTTSSGTITLTSDLVFTGTYTITGAGTVTITFAGAGIINSPNGTIQLTVSGGNLTISTTGTHNILNYYFNAGGFAINSSGTWNVYGDVIRNGSGTGRSGTGTINFVGTGSILFNGGSTGAFVGTWNINTAGTITFGSVTFPTVYYEQATMNYISGTVNTSNGVLAIGYSNSSITTTLNTGSILWSNIALSGFGVTNTLVITSNFNVVNLSTTSGTININGSGLSIFVSGNLSVVSAALAGTATIILNGTGIWSGGGNVRNNLTINTTGTITISGTVAYNTGTLTYTAGTVTTTSSTLSISLSTTLNVNGIVWNNLSITGGAVTLTLSSNITSNGLTTLGSLGSPIITINGVGINLICNGGLSIATTTGYVIGTANIRMTGGTITGAASLNGGYVQVSTFEIAGNVTFSSTGVIYIYGGPSATGNFTYTSGTVTTTGSTIWFNACNLNSNGITWNNVWILSGASVPLVLISNMLVNGLLTLGYLTINIVINNNGTTKTITAVGGISMSGTTSIVSGTADIIATGGTITGTSSVQLRNNLEIIGNITFANGVTFSYNTGTLKYTSGTVITTGSTLSCTASTTFNTAGITWNNFTIVNTITLTLSSNLNISGTLTLSTTLSFTAGVNQFLPTGNISVTGATTVTLPNNISVQTFSVSAGVGTTFNSNTLTINGNLTLGSSATTIAGTSTLILGGTGTWSGAGLISSNLTINTSGTITISGTVACNSNTITYTAGTVITTGSQLNIYNNITFNTGSLLWNFIFIFGPGVTNTSSTITLTGDLNVDDIWCYYPTSFSATGTNKLIVNSNFRAGNAVADRLFGTIGTITVNIPNDLYVKNLFLYANINANLPAFVYGTSLNNFQITVTGDIYLTGNGSYGSPNPVTFSGTTTIVWTGSLTSSMVVTTTYGFFSHTLTLNGTRYTFSSGAYFNGNVTINGNGNTKFNGNFIYSTNTLTSNCAVDATNCILSLISSCTLRNMNRISFGTVTVTAGSTITMNEFFNGTTNKRTIVQSSTTTNYTITFQDNFEKLARNIRISNATLSRPNQLTIITDKGNRGNNIGIKFYSNQLPNGIAKNLPPSPTQTTYLPGGLVTDPCFV